MIDEKGNYVRMSETESGKSITTEKPYDVFLRDIAGTVVSELTKKFPKQFSESITMTANHTSANGPDLNSDTSNGTPAIFEARRLAVEDFKKKSAQGLTSSQGVHIFGELYQKGFTREDIRNVMAKVEREQLGIA
ncbi:MAG: hypothetical protein WC975_06560 [Phycisphaerae bacterium]